MSHCGTPPFNDHLDHCFNVFKHIQQSFFMKTLDVWFNTINIIQNIDHSSRFLTSVNDNKSPRSLCSLSPCSPKQKQSNPTIREQTARLISIQRPKRRFRNLLNCVKLTHATYRNVCMTSKNAQCSSRNGFWILKISRKIRVLKQSQSALFCSITHMTILFVFTCMMNVRNQSIQAFATSLGPFCDGSCEFVHWL